MEVLLGKTLTELQDVALSCGLKKFAGKQLAEWLYVRRVTTFDEMTNISLAGRKALAEQYAIGRKEPVAEAISEDGTRKFLFAVETSRGSEYVESVYIPSEDRATLCVSTQAGCRMGCKFCMTGTLGFHGHLTAADILNQILYSMSLATTLSPLEGGNGGSLTNLVYMGEGEPMDNISSVMRSIEVMTAEWGAAWSPHRITVSTVGAGEGLDRFLKESECQFAVSLHNPFADERAAIMPAEKIRPLRQVLNWASQQDFRHQRRISFEYIVWSGKNDTLRHARELVRILTPFAPQCRVNLIRFHEAPDDGSETGLLKSEDFPPTDETKLQWLCDYLNDNGITTTIRRSRGKDILAACGMLVNSLKEA